MRSLVVLACIVLSATSASGQLMGLYSDAQGTNCAIDIPLGTTATCYVVLQPSPTCGTILSGTCAIQDMSTGLLGNPPSTLYTVSSEPGPQLVSSTGSPNFGFGASFVIDCQNDGTSPIVLYTLTVTNFADTFGGRIMRVIGNVTRCGGTSCNNSPTESSWNISPGRVAELPTPADFATNVPTDLRILRWNGGEGGHPCEGPSSGISDVYFGTSTNPPLVATTTMSRYDITNTLQRVTTYYWRIETTKLPEGTRVIGPTWQFTTVGASRYCAAVCPGHSPCPGGCILGQCITEPAASASATEQCGIGGPATNHGSINRRTGGVSATSGFCFDGATASNATAVDRFWIGGPPSPTPIGFRVVFQCMGSGTGRLRVDEQDVGEFFVGTRTFSFDLTKNVDEPFEVEYHVTGAPATQTGSGSMQGALRFEGLPEGYMPFSCWGYGSSVAVQPSTWSLVKSRYR